MKKVIIIGAGPIGLYLAGRFESSGIDYLILEASDKMGGQLTSLYPEKEISDIPGISSLCARDYIRLLQAKVNPAKIKFGIEVINILSREDRVDIIAKHNTYQSDFAVIATGLGFYKPRTMGIAREEEFANIIYSLKSFDFLKGKRVAILGGGDSAIDWAKEISRLSDNVFLIHRRREFRGDISTISQAKSLRILTPYIPFELAISDNEIDGLIIKHVEDESLMRLDVDYILVNYGNIPSPVAFDVPKENAGVICDENRCVRGRIYAIGDAIGVKGKIKRIASGLADADAVYDVLASS